MARTAIRLSTAWRSLITALDPAVFRRRLRANLEIAGERTGREFAARARRAIQREDYDPNSPITVALKGSSTPLVADSDLFNSLTYQVVDRGHVVRLGVIRQRGATPKAVNIARILHEGAKIDVNQHPQVRRAVMAKLRARGAAGRAAAAALTPRGSDDGDGPGIWRIPGRPFITSVTEDPGFHEFFLRQYTQALRATFLGGG